VRWILDIAHNSMLTIVFLAVLKYRMQSARKVFAVVIAFTDLGSRYSRSRRNAGDSIPKNGARRSTWYSTSSFRAMSTRKGLRMWVSSVVCLSSPLLSAGSVVLCISLR